MSSSLARNFIVQTVGKGLSVVIGLFTLAVITRALGAEAFGAYTTAVTFLQFFGVIVDFGLTLALVVMISEPGADEERITGNVFTLRMASAVLLFVVAPFAALLFPWSGTVKAGVAIGAAGYACMAGATLLVGLFQKHRQAWRASVAEVVNRVVLLGLSALAMAAGWGVEAMLWALTIANALYLVMSLRLARPLVAVRLRFEFDVWRAVLTRSWPVAVSILFNLVYLKGDVLLLSVFRGEADVGLYAAAYRFIDVLTVLPTMFMGLLLPSLVADWKSGKREEFARHLSRAFDAFAVMYLPIVAGAFALSGPLMTLVAGSDFAGSGAILRLLMLALPGIFLGALYGHAVLAVNRQRRMIFGYAVCAVLSLGAYFFLIPRFGTTGAAAVTIASESFIALATFGMVFVVSHAVPSLKIFGKAAVAAGLMYGLLKVVPGLPVLPAILMGAAFYSVLLFAFGVLRKELLRDVMPTRLAAHKQ